MFETFVNSSLMLSVGGVKVILDAIIRASRQLLGYISPFVAQLFVQVKNHLFLLSVDGIFFNVWIKMIMPSKRNQQKRSSNAKIGD